MSKRMLCDEHGSLITIRDLCRLRMLGYSEGLKELAECFQKEYIGQRTDRKEAFEQYKLWEDRQVIKSNFDELSQIMSQLASDLFSYIPLDDKRMKMIRHRLRAEGIYLQGACQMPKMSENRAMAMTLSTIRRDCVSAEYIAELLSSVLKKKMKVSVNSPLSVDEKQQIFLFVEEPQYYVLTGYARAQKEGEKISGDNYSILESERGNLCMILSDGTGSGEEACDESTQVLDLLEKMLETGYEKEQALGLINVAMCALERRFSHPTLDFCDIDLYSGICGFYKVGGSTSYVKRKDEILSIQGGNLPLGIFRKVEYIYRNVSLEDEDYIIMVTDGVLDSFSGDGQELIWENYISNLKAPNPWEMANLILQKAIFQSKGHIKDDMTVLVAGSSSNS